MSKSKAYDLAAASPFILLFAFSIFGTGLQIQREMTTHAPSLQLALWIGAKTASAIFAGFQIVLFLIRRLPVAKSRGWSPRLVAVVGAISAVLFLALPSAPPSAYLSIVSSVFIITGTVGSILAISYLGRSFSVTPQARAFVASGPYRAVRHPLYLAEQMACFGIMWQYRQPWALLVFAIGVLAQFPRMHYEEQVLREAFPAYGEYAKRVPRRLVPGVY